MLKATLKAVGSLSKAGKSKKGADIVQAAEDTSRAVSKLAAKKKKKSCKC